MSESFRWTVEEHLWPPAQRPHKPFGPTALESLSRCPLKRCFEVSQGYERRTHFAARIGIALHHVIESLIDNPTHGDSQIAADRARAMFLNELALQIAEAQARPRERGLPRLPDRVKAAEQAAVTEAHRLCALDLPTTYHGSSATDSAPEAATVGEADIEAEIVVSSSDGYFCGQIDRVERTDAGIRLIDTKTTLRTELQPGYERQIQMYAFLWHESRREWPVEGQVVYPLTSLVHRIDVTPSTCCAVAAEARDLVDRVLHEPRASHLAQPGDGCRTCEFRPWCQPFWDWQREEPSRTQALHQATSGFEGEIISLQVVQKHWKIRLAWRDARITILCPQERFPHLENTSVGSQIRCLDMELSGLVYEPKASITESSEVFLMPPTGTRGGMGVRASAGP